MLIILIASYCMATVGVKIFWLKIVSVTEQKPSMGQNNLSASNMSKIKVSYGGERNMCHYSSETLWYWVCSCTLVYAWNYLQTSDSTTLLFQVSCSFTHILKCINLLYFAILNELVTSEDTTVEIRGKVNGVTK